MTDRDCRQTSGAVPSGDGHCTFLLMIFNFSPSKLAKQIGEGWTHVVSSSNARALGGKVVLSPRSLVVYEGKVAR